MLILYLSCDIFIVSCFIGSYPQFESKFAEYQLEAQVLVSDKF